MNLPNGKEHPIGTGGWAADFYGSYDFRCGHLRGYKRFF
jgi:hypothetical protein